MEPAEHDAIPQDVNAIGRDVLDAAIEVHRELGPGLLERAYQACLAHALQRRGRAVRVEVPVPLEFQDERVDAGFRIDLLVDDTVVIELKAVEQVTDVHRAQVLTYLKLAGHRLGYLINFNQTKLIRGFHRFVR